MSNKINGNDSIKDIIVKMCEGNPGAMQVLVAIMESGSTVDPDDIMGGVGKILLLDTFGIYGTDIYILNNDICDRDIAKTIAVIRATQMGIFDVDVLKDACGRQDRSGVDMIPVDELYEKVKEALPNFDVES